MRIIKTAALSLALGAAMTMAASTGAYAKGAYAPLVLKANEDTFLRFIVWNQVWGRLIDQNPGTTVQGKKEATSLDIGLRRSRFLAFGKLGKEVTLMFHFGVNNQTFRNNAFKTGGPVFFVHDAWVEYCITDSDAFHLAVGGGLNYWNGVSRSTNASTLNLMTVDAPITNWATINSTDQFARQLGVYAKGDIAGGLVDYRIALNKPFAAGAFNSAARSFAVASYIKLQLMDKESNALPYAVGTYLGAKSIFNLGVGAHYQPAGGRGGDDLYMFGADVFADLPFGEKAEGGALTAYLVGYLFDFGENEALGDVVRNIGIMNIADGGPNAPTLNGFGNGYASVGNGTSVYASLGYMLPGGLLQPYVAGQISAWDAYDDVSPVLEGGLNLLLNGHHSKLTLHYRARPLMVANTDDAGNVTANFDGFKSELILQAMLFL